MSPGFEPDQGICEILAIRLPNLIDIVLDSSNDDMLEKGSVWGENFIGALYDEMNEGFDDLQVMKDCIKAFINLLIKTAIDPAKAGIA